MRARRKLFFFALLSSVLILRISTASAAPPRIAPLVPAFSPEKDKEIVDRFHDAIAAGLTASKVPLLGARAVRAKIARPCAALACAEQSRGRLGVSHVVYGRIETVGKNYTIELQLQPGKMRVKDRCDICTLMEALSTTRKLATKLGKDSRASLLAAAAPAVVKRKPPITKAPPAPKAPTPPPPTPATKSEDPPAVKAPVADLSPSTRSQWPLWPTLVAAGVGVVGLAVGIPLLSMDGDFTNCRGTAMPDGRNCEDRYATSGSGWALTAMGIAGLATSGVLFYLYLRGRGEQETTQAAPRGLWRQVSLLPTESGFVIHAGGSF